MPTSPDDDPVNDVTDEWDKLFPWSADLDLFEELDDYEPEPEYGDFWPERDDSED